jgi:hypothetical protein
LFSSVTTNNFVFVVGVVDAFQLQHPQHQLKQQRQIGSSISSSRTMTQGGSNSIIISSQQSPPTTTTTTSTTTTTTTRRSGRSAALHTTTTAAAAAAPMSLSAPSLSLTPTTSSPSSSSSSYSSPSSSFVGIVTTMMTMMMVLFPIPLLPLSSQLHHTPLRLVLPVANANGEVGRRITQAVTTSDLGVAVRTNVVKSAQVIDTLDGKWEQLSDKYNLGNARLKAGSKPKSKVIPDRRPLNIDVASRTIQLSDKAFLQAIGNGQVSQKQLDSEVQRVANLVKVSYERSELVQFDSDIDIDLLKFQNAQQYNFVTYCHYRSYAELYTRLEKEYKTTTTTTTSKTTTTTATTTLPTFNTVRKSYEKMLGDDLVSLLKLQETAASSSSSSKKLEQRLELALQQIDVMGDWFVNNGFVAAFDRSKVDKDILQDFVDGDTDLEFSVALDVDATLQSQLLLQEQGYRLYPNWGRLIVQSILQQALMDGNDVESGDAADDSSAAVVSVMDYYFDTDYNSDPNKFDVKEVLLSVSITPSSSSSSE